MARFEVYLSEEDRADLSEQGQELLSGDVVFAHRNAQTPPEEAERKGTQMLATFKSLAVDRMDLDEMVALKVFGDGLLKGYADHELVPPSWVGENVSELNREIGLRRRDNLEKARKSVNARIEALKPAPEKRQDLQKELEHINTALGE